MTTVRAAFAAASAFITLPSDTNRFGTSSVWPNSFPIPVSQPHAHASGIEVVTSGI